MNLTFTRKGRWQVGSNEHDTSVEALQDAAQQALAAPGTPVTAQPPTYIAIATVQSTGTSAPSPAPSPPPSGLPSAKFNTTQIDMRVSAWDKSKGAVTITYDWGDGSKPDVITVAPGDDGGHTYAAAGVYTITQTATNASGSAAYTVNVTVPPVAGSPGTSPAPSAPAPAAPAPSPAPAPAPVGPRAAFAGAALNWTHLTSADVVDVTVTPTQCTRKYYTGEYTTQTDTVSVPPNEATLVCHGAPIGVTPLACVDGSPHSHLTVCRYADGVCIENAWLDATLEYVGDVTITVNGKVVCTETGVNFWIRSRTAVVRTGMTQITPTRDWAPTDLPNYGNPGSLGITLSQSANVANRWGPNGLGQPYNVSMHTTGGRSDIGLIPGWDLPWACQGNDWDVVRKINDHSAVWPIHIRDPETGMILSPHQYGDASLVYIWKPDFAAGHHNPIAAPTSCPYGPNGAHQTHFCVVTYLSTHSDYDQEEMLSWALFDSIEENPSYRDYGKCIVTGSTRRIAWVLAQYAYVAALLPDAHPYKADYRQSLRDTATTWWTTKYAPGMPCHNIFGALLDFAYADGSAHYRGIAPWMNYYLASALHQLVRYGFDEYKDWRDFSAGMAVGGMNELCYQLATFYNWWLVDPSKSGSRGQNEASAANLWTSWKQVHDDMLTTSYDGAYAKDTATPCGQLAINGQPVGMMSGATGGAQSYPAMIQPALAAAVDAGLPGATDAWTLLQQWGGHPDFASANGQNIVPEPAGG